MVKNLSHPEMAQPFITRARCIRQSLTILHRENLPKTFSDEISGILENHEKICSVVIPAITKKTGHRFMNPELFFIVFPYKEISQVFNRIEQQAMSGKFSVPLSPEIFPDMKKIREDHLTLAFFGDSAIELGVLPTIWSQTNEGEIPLKSTLNDTKKLYTTRKNQAKIWDYLLLSEYEFPQESDDFKSSLFEAIFGIIYFERGLEAVENAIHLLDQNRSAIFSKSS